MSLDLECKGFAATQLFSCVLFSLFFWFVLVLYKAVSLIRDEVHEYRDESGMHEQLQVVNESATRGFVVSLLCNVWSLRSAYLSSFLHVFSLSLHIAFIEALFSHQCANGNSNSQTDANRIGMRLICLCTFLLYRLGSALLLYFELDRNCWALLMQLTSLREVDYVFNHIRNQRAVFFYVSKMEQSAAIASANARNAQSVTQPIVDSQIRSEAKTEMSATFTTTLSEDDRDDYETIVRNESLMATLLVVKCAVELFPQMTSVLCIALLHASHSKRAVDGVDVFLLTAAITDLILTTEYLSRFDWLNVKLPYRFAFFDQSDAFDFSEYYNKVKDNDSANDRETHSGHSTQNGDQKKEEKTKEVEIWTIGYTTTKDSSSVVHATGSRQNAEVKMLLWNVGCGFYNARHGERVLFRMADISLRVALFAGMWFALIKLTHDRVAIGTVGFWLFAELLLCVICARFLGTVSVLLHLSSTWMVANASTALTTVSHRLALLKALTQVIQLSVVIGCVVSTHAAVSGVLAIVLLSIVFCLVTVHRWTRFYRFFS